MAAIHFTVILDFLIVMPLGPQYMRVFRITPGQFGLIVSAYAMSAAMGGVAAAFFLDRFDRKSAMLVLYTGFALGTLCCALAPDYRLLLAARTVAGGFGGVAGALILAVVGDAIPEHRRGAAMGMVMSSFSLAAIGGVPIGLVLANHFSWHAPFFTLAGVSLLVLGFTARVMPSMRGHLQPGRAQHPARQLGAVLMRRDHQAAFLFMALLTFTGFGIFPYISNFLVANVGLTETQLPIIYLCGGSSTLISMNLIGRWADRAGKRRVFTIMSLAAAVPILVFTNLPRVPLMGAVLVTTVFMVCMSGRMVPAMAMMTASVEPQYRGGFMSVNSSVQHFSSGLMTLISGQIIGQSSTGAMTNFRFVGIMAVICAYTCIYLARFIRPPTGTDVIQPPLAVEQW